MIRRMTDAVPSGRELIQRVTTSSGEWQLQRRGGHYEIICNGVFLMASYNRESGRRLASLALERVKGDELRVLVGGLGIGHTAQAVLEDRRVDRLEIVEVEPLVAAWHRAYFADLCGRPLDDPRTVLIEHDLFDVPVKPKYYDAILLDTDNGPNWLARDVNSRIYEESTLLRFLSALTPRGVLGFWSANPSQVFAMVLEQAGAHVELLEAADEIAPGRQVLAWIYLARVRS